MLPTIEQRAVVSVVMIDEEAGCRSRVIALGILSEADRLGIAVPDDLSVIGFDDIPWAQFMRPALATIDMPLQQMAAEAVDVLVRRLAQPAGFRRRTVLDVELIRRETVRRID